MGCQGCQQKKNITQTFKKDVRSLIEQIKQSRNTKKPVKGLDNAKKKE